MSLLLNCWLGVCTAEIGTLGLIRSPKIRGPVDLSDLEKKHTLSVLIFHLQPHKISGLCYHE